MLNLNSPRWKELKASPDGNGELAAKLLKNVRDGDTSSYDELYHQVCHQFSVGEVAYAIVPHLVDLAINNAEQHDLWPLRIVGTIAASRLAYPVSSAAIPDDLVDDYKQANERALRLVTDALRLSTWESGESLELTSVLAALHGHYNLAMLLFLAGGTADLSCPECGEYIQFGESQEAVNAT